MTNEQKSLHVLLRNSRTSTKLVTLVLVFMVSFSFYGLYCFNTVKEVKINGPLYQRIVQGKDVIADILPPPEYLIESYLNVFQMLASKGPEDLAGLIAKTRALKSDYLVRHAYWASALPEDGLRSALLKDSHDPAMRMLDAVDRDFIPALQAGNRVLAEKVLWEKIRPAYAEHRAAIDKVVSLAVNRNREDESRAGVAVQSRAFGQTVLGVFLFVLLTVFSSYLVRQIEAAHAVEAGDGISA